MSLARIAASNPAGVIPLECLMLSHSAWPAPERRVMQPDDWTVTIGGTPTLFKGVGASEAGAWQSAHPATDDTAMAQRQIVLDDVDERLWGLIESVRSSTERVACSLYLFASNALAAPLYAETLSLQSAATSGGTLTLAAQTIDTGNRRFPRILHTLANSPGLRGRKS